MPKKTRLDDRRGHGRGDNVSGVNRKKANLQDQRKKGAYSPAAPSTKSEFTAGVSSAAMRTQGAGAKAKTRTAPKANKLGEKK